MSYNGIGLSTARGTATNGYVQKNASFVKHKKVTQQSTNYLQAPEHRLRTANKEILDHELKRKVEVKLVELEDELEAKGLPEDEIEEILSKERQVLLQNLSEFVDKEQKQKIFQTHQLAEAKERDIANFGAALGIRKDYVSGQAFDTEYQEEQKLERIKARAAREADSFLENQFKE